MSKRLRICLNILLALVVVAGLAVLLRQQLQYREIAAGQARAEAAAGLGGTPQPETGNPSPSPLPLPLPEEAAGLASLDLDALREVNPDVAGWLLVPGTGISHPVLQGPDNDYYLKHSWERKWSSGGAVFLDCRCSRDFDGFHSIIYGHRMNNGSMFGSLQRYEDPDFWRDNPSVYLATDGAVYRYDIFAVWEPSVTSPVYGVLSGTQEERREFAALCRSSSQIDTGIDPGPDDRLLTLSTCTERGHATRWVVQAVRAQTYVLS